jgi:hypothetical protein
MGMMRNPYTITVRKPEGKVPLGKSKRRWEDNLKMDLKETGWGRGLESRDLCEHSDVALSFSNDLEFLYLLHIRFPWRTLLNGISYGS